MSRELYSSQVWRVIASEMRDFDNVIGYNILNEPWAGNVYKVEWSTLIGRDLWRYCPLIGRDVKDTA